MSEQTEEKQSFQAEVWQTLSSLDVSEHTEKKMKLTYLSWAWAWGTLMNHYPESTYKFKEFELAILREGAEHIDVSPLPYRQLPNQTCEVWITLTIRRGEHSWTQEMWLPVLNHANKPIQNPTTMELNTSRMRCLTKAMAMFGLGHYIYAGEDLPDKKGQSVVETVIQESGLDKNDPRIPDYKSGIAAALANEDNPGLFELMDELGQDQDLKVLVWQVLDSKQRSKIKALTIERKDAA